MRLLYVVWLPLLALLPLAALAQWSPMRPIRMVVGFPSGGPIDTVARILAPHFVEGLGQPVIVDNRAGANGIIATDIVAKAAPDGHTLFFGTTGNLSVNPSLYPKLPFDIGRDFTPVTQVASTSSLIKAGRLRALATTKKKKKRLALLPDIPTAGETLPGFEVDNWYGLVVPAGTARAAVTRLHGEIVRIINSPAVKEKLPAQGMEPVGSAPREFEAFMKSELTKWARVVKSAHIRPE